MNIRYKQPDKKSALSIIDAAERDMQFTKTLPLTEEAGTTIVRNIYESFRMIGEGLLIAKGIKAEDHITQINELINLNLETSRPLRILDNLRRMRHTINYYGYRPTSSEIKEIHAIAEALFKPILDEVRKKIEK